MYLFNNSRWSPVSLLFLIVGNSAYRPSLETLNTPGIKVFDKQWRGYRILEVVDHISDKHFPVIPHSSNTDVIKAFEDGSNSLQFLVIQVRIFSCIKHRMIPE
jgi:hypothetical protein